MGEKLKKKEIKITLEHLDKFEILKHKNSKLFKVAEYPIEVDNRFIFWTFINENNLMGNDAKDYEIICYDDHEIREIENKYYYISKDKNRPLEQSEIDQLLFIKIFTSDVYNLDDLLNYQLNKYENKLKRLNDLLTQFEDINNFNSEVTHPNSNFKFMKENYQKHCLRWVNDKLKEYKNLSKQSTKNNIQMGDNIYNKLITEIKNVCKLDNVRVNEFLNIMLDIYDDINNEIISINDIGFLKNKLKQIDNFVYDYSIESMLNQFSYTKDELNDEIYKKLWSDDYTQLEDSDIKRFQFKYNLGILHERIIMVKYSIDKRINEIAPLTQQKETIAETKQPKPEIKPIFKHDAIETIFDIIKGYFPDQQKELKQVLDTGKIPESKLLFHGNGKTLLDFFKQLIQGQFLNIAVQRDFEKWVSDGFEYLHRSNQTKFTPKYASKIISGNERAAKGNRLINVQSKDGKFEIILLKIENREQDKKYL